MKKRQIIILIIILAFIGTFQILKVSFSNFDAVQEEQISSLEELKIGEKEVPLSVNGLEDFLSNEKSRAVTAKPKEGWEITEVRYYPENNLNLKGGKKGKATERIYNNIFLGAEEKSQKIEMNSSVEYGKCYTHFYIYLKNLESGMKSKEAVTVFAYDELIIDWGEMIDGQAQFVFNVDYLAGDELKNEDYVMVYKKEPMKNNVAEFNSKYEFIHDASQYCLIDSFNEEFSYKENRNQITIKIKKDCGLRSVSVKNEGAGTGIKLVRI